MQSHLSGQITGSTQCQVVVQECACEIWIESTESGSISSRFFDTEPAKHDDGEGHTRTEGVEEFALTETESDTESVHLLRRRRLMLQFSRGEPERESVEEEQVPEEPPQEKDIIFVPHARAMSIGFRSLDEVNLDGFRSERVGDEVNPQVLQRHVSWCSEIEFATDLCWPKRQYCRIQRLEVGPSASPRRVNPTCKVLRMC